MNSETDMPADETCFCGSITGMHTFVYNMSGALKILGQVKEFLVQEQDISNITC